jgi:hypothetical protein
MQALTELLFLPPPIAAFVQQQVSASTLPLAITAVAPGHCLWHVRKVSVARPEVSAEPTASGHAVASLPECVAHFASDTAGAAFWLRSI